MCYYIYQDCYTSEQTVLVEKEFERLQTARDILTDDEQRQNYDKWRQSGIAIPFKKWCGMRDAVHTVGVTSSLLLIVSIY